MKKKRATLRSRRNGPDNSAVLAADKAIQHEIRMKWKRLKPFTAADELALTLAEAKRARKAERMAKGMHSNGH